MIALEAKKIAEAFLAKENLRGWKYKLEEPITEGKYQGEWNIQVRWISPEGVSIDGPGVVIVCEKTREARFFE